MEKMSLSIDAELQVMCEWGLTAEEWLFIKLLFMAQDPESKPQYLHKYFVETQKVGIPMDTIISLQNKKIISKDFKIPAKGSALDVNTIVFSKSFLNKYFKYSSEAGMELFAAYPPYLTGAKGVLLPARNITKVGYNDIEDFCFAYGKAIKFSRPMHARVLESLEFAKKNDLIRYGIGEYFASRKWLEHMEMMEKDQIGEFTNTFDTTETL